MFQSIQQMKYSFQRQVYPEYNHLVFFSSSQALNASQRRCEELEESLTSRSQVLEMLQEEVSSADQQKQVQILLFWMPVCSYLNHVALDTVPHIGRYLHMLHF